MTPALTTNDIIVYVENNIGTFHQKRIDSLDKLKLSKVLERKNPYLFKAKNVLTAQEIVEGIINAHISSSEEAIFGEFLEGLAIYINDKVYAGSKSAAEGIDLEFVREGIKYIVSIKSGPNWGNSSQIQKMRDNFSKAKRILGTNTSKQNIVAVNGCCYGRSDATDQKDHVKLCGQRFWEFISGMPELYKEIIEPVGHEAKEKNDMYLESYANMINKFTREFINDYCNDDGSINWDKIVEYNSAITRTKKP
jgi:hypothetical protein